MNSRSLIILLTFVLAITASFVLFWNLGSHSISLRSDEVIYVRVSQAVLNDDAWFPLRHGKTAFFEKPPLKLWLGALAPALLGESTFSYRLLDALIGVGIILLTVLLSLKIFRAPFYGIAASILFLGAFEFTASHHGLRRAVLDSLIVLLTLASAIICYRSTTLPRDEYIPRRDLLLVGLFAGLGILTKSVAGLLPIIWFGGNLFLNRRFKELPRVFLWSFLSALVIGALYYLPVCLLHTRATTTLFGAELFTRVFEGIEGHNTGDPFYYFRFLFLRSGAIPWALLAAGTLIAVLWSYLDQRFRFLLVWAYGPVILFSFSSSKAPWYLHPSIPFLSLLCVAAVCELPKKAKLPIAASAVTLASLIVVVISSFQYERLLRRVATTVLAQNIRIDVELLVDNIREEPATKVVIADSALSFRSGPKLGRFNVEGFYANFIRDRISQAPSDALADQEALHGDAILFIPNTALAKIPGRPAEQIVLPAFGQRFEPITAVRYGKATFPRLPHLGDKE